MEPTYVIEVIQGETSGWIKEYGGVSIMTRHLENATRFKSLVEAEQSACYVPQEWQPIIVELIYNPVMWTVEEILMREG